MNEPDEFRAKEAMQVANFLRNMIGRELLAHPFVTAHRRSRRHVEKALAHMSAAYQVIGAVRFRTQKKVRGAGGKAAAANMTAAQRSERARKGAAARWSKRTALSAGTTEKTA